MAISEPAPARQAPKNLAVSQQILKIPQISKIHELNSARKFAYFE